MCVARFRAIVGLIVSMLSLAVAGCGGSSGDGPAPGRRVLGIVADPRMIPPPTSDDYLAAVELVRAAGARGQFLPYTWSALEPTPGTYDVSDLTTGVRYLGGIRDMQLYVSIAVVSTSLKETPADLEGVPFDDPLMKSRFHALVDALAPELSDPHVAYVAIGNEVDPYLGATNEWSAYQNFYEDAAAYVRAKVPGIKVGVCVTYRGANGQYKQEIAGLNRTSDIWATTYYPLNADYTPIGTPPVHDDLRRMVSLAGGRPVVVQEIGYPTASVLNSSEQQQADFLRNVFDEWAAIGGSIPFLNIFVLHDLTPDTCATIAAREGKPDNAALQAFLCSVGLRQQDGTPKLGWQAVVDGAARTGLPQ